MQIKSLFTPQGNFADITGKSGAKYTVTNEILVGRWEAFEKYQLEAGYGVSLSDLFQSMKKVHESFNQNKHGDAIIQNYNTMHRVAKLADGHRNPTLMLCMLFINKEGEDLSVFDDKQAKNKLQDLSEYKASDFFLFAQRLLEQFTKELNESTQPSSTKNPKKKSS